MVFKSKSERDTNKLKLNKASKEIIGVKVETHILENSKIFNISKYLTFEKNNNIDKPSI